MLTHFLFSTFSAIDQIELLQLDVFIFLFLFCLLSFSYHV